jgi:hypothetical protein
MRNDGKRLDNGIRKSCFWMVFASTLSPSSLGVLERVGHDSEEEKN